MFGNGSFFCFKKLGFRDENQKKSSVELKCKIPLECGKQKANFLDAHGIPPKNIWAT